MADGGCATPMLLRFGGFALDLARRVLLDARGGEVPVRPKILELLRVLALAAGRTVPKAELMDTVWPGINVTEDSLFQCVREARRALDDPKGRLLRNLARRGYLLDAPVRSEPVGLDPCAGPAVALLDRTSLAVLPFANLDGGPAEDCFANGLAEELATVLSRVGAFPVVPCGSNVACRGPDARLVARELGVRYLLEGGVRRAGSRLRVTCRLVDAGTGGQIWADRIDGETKDAFALQDRIAHTVAAAAEPRMMAAEVARVTRKGETDLTAHDLYLRALPRSLAPTERGKAKGVELLRRAVALDPGHARALASLALCLQIQWDVGWRTDVPDPAVEALRLSGEALAVDRADPLVLAVAASVAETVRGDHDEARALAAQALASGVPSALVWTMTGHVAMWGGEFDEAIRRFGTAMRLDPQAPFAGSMHHGMAAAHLFARRFEAAEHWARRAAANSPAYSFSWRCLVASLALQGREEETRRAVEDAAEELRRPRGKVFPQWSPAWRRPRHPWMGELFAEGLGRAEQAG